MKNKNLPNFEFHTSLQKYFDDASVPLWLKLVHLFILTDARSNKKGGYTITYQNPSLMKRFDVSKQPTITKAITIIENMNLLERKVNQYGERKIKLNRSAVLNFLRHHDITDDAYMAYRAKSRERKLIRRKIFTIVQYVNEYKRYKHDQYMRYLNMQQKKYNIDITVNDFEKYDISNNEIVTRAELETYLHQQLIHKKLDEIYDKIGFTNELHQN